MNLQILWYGLVGLLLAGYFILEGYDYGIGILLPFLSKDDRERRVLLNAMGPFWLGNETWLVAAFGAMFAAFPRWYGTFLSSLYGFVLLLIFSLILRGAALEFRSHRASKRWRGFWDLVICGGSIVPGLVWGVIAAALVQGLPLDAQLRFVGTPWQLLTPLALLWGLTFIAMFALQGALFLRLRVDATVTTRVERVARRLWIPALFMVVLLAIVGAFVSQAMLRLLAVPWIAPLSMLVPLLLFIAGQLIQRQRWWWALVSTSLSMLCGVCALAMSLFPHLLLSSLQPAWSLTVERAVAAPSSLVLLTWVALIFLPIIITYQALGYWIFRKRLHMQSRLHY